MTSPAPAPASAGEGEASARRRTTWLCAGAALHVALAALAWLRATGWTGAAPDISSGALAGLASVVAATVAAGALLGLSRRVTRPALAAVFVLLAVQGVVQWRLDASTFTCESQIASVVAPSDDGRFTFAIVLCEPFATNHFATLQLTRVADQKSWRLRLPISRGARDAFDGGATWGRLTALGQDHYWLAVSTALARSGPDYFVLETEHATPRLKRVRRGLSVENGRAHWDCAEWPGPGAADPAARDLTDANGLTPPERMCRLEKLAGRCDGEMFAAIAARPEWAADVSAARDCVLEKTGESGDPLAWDARFALALEDGNPAGALAVADAAFEKERPLDERCADARRAARRLVVGRRTHWLRPWREGAEGLLLAWVSGSPADCAALGATREELRRELAAVEWDASVAQRALNDNSASCATARRLAESGRVAALEEPDRTAAQEWAAVCAELNRDYS